VWYTCPPMSDPHGPPAVDDEPKTPMWLPALGAALFLSAGLWWAVRPEPPPPPAPVASASAPITAPPAPAPTPVPPPQVASARQPVPANLPPDLQRRINDARAHPRP
jgi:translation initiation factor IF-2